MKPWVRALQRSAPRIVALLTLMLAGATAASEVSIQRLTWAGLKMMSGDTTVFVDAVGTDIWDGAPPGGLISLTADTRRRYALITHVHNDHFDVASLREVLGERGYVICDEAIATYVASRGLKVIPVKHYVPVQRGGFTFTAVPGVDGFGDDQVSWVITHGDRRYLHAGDTLWHGRWSAYGDHYGPFDAVFLPINGALLGGDFAAEVPAVMTPDQAVEAALLLRATRLVPIHFGFHDPPGYAEVEDALGKLTAAAARRKVTLVVLGAGDYLSVP